jgi:hypothetical protein
MKAAAIWFVFLAANGDYHLPLRFARGRANLFTAESLKSRHQFLELWF